jgi:hypothetical protein
MALERARAAAATAAAAGWGAAVVGRPEAPGRRRELGVVLLRGAEVVWRSLLLLLLLRWALQRVLHRCVAGLTRRRSKQLELRLRLLLLRLLRRK